MRTRLAAGGAAVGLCLVAYAILSGESDDELIRRRLDQLEDAVRVEGPENPVFRAARMNEQFAEIFEEDVRVRIPELTSLSKGRSGLAAMATRAGTLYESADVDFSDIDVRIDGSELNALVLARAGVSAIRAGRSRRDERRVSLRFSKNDGRWQVASISVTPWAEENGEVR